LVAGVVPFALFAGSASAATGTASVSPVRFTTGVAVPNARASFDLTMGGTTNVALTVAPAGGTLVVSDDTTVTLAAAGTNVTVVNGGSDDSYIELSATAAGRYAGSIYDGTDTATFDFTTVGSPVSMTLTPASQTVLQDQAATLTVTLKDSAGNTTQPAAVDAIGVADNTDDTVAPTAIAADDIFDGTAAVTLTTLGNGAGTTTVTATPLGTLPSYGVTAQTATVTKSGSVSTVDALSAIVTTPANAVSSPAITDDTVDRAVEVPTGTSAVTVTIDDTTGNATGSMLRFKLTPSAGTVTVGGESGSNSSPLFVDVTTNSSRQATIAATLSGAALLDNATLTVKQVKVDDSNVSAGAGLVVSQNDRAVSASTISVSPDDSVVGAIGTAIPVTVTVTDQFGDPQSGWTINAYRGATTGGTYLNQATTNASGSATVSVVNATGITTGTMENYSFSAQPTLGSVVNKNDPLQVTWTTDGGITSLSVAVVGGASTPIADPAGTAPTTGALLTVPFDGTANTQSTATFNLTTDAAGGTANGGEVVELQPTATPQNNVTVTVPLGSEGVYVSSSASTAWNEGETSVTVSSGTSVYVFGTKAGTTSVELTSGGKTVTVPVKIQTSVNAAYNIAATPTTQSVAKGGFTTVTVAITDVFGNSVGATTDDTGAVTVTATGEVLLGGYQSTQTVNMGATGTATVTVIAGNAAGAGALAITPKSGTLVPAWQTGYTPPTGAPAPTTSAAAAILVEDDTTKSISIVGTRTTVSGKPGIMIDGVTTGIEDGKTVVPYFRFPGQTEYSQGTARPVITDGEFTWQRKTGKKFYAYVTNDDGAVKSNRVIIPAK
jgi:hypothetical protein